MKVKIIWITSSVICFVFFYYSFFLFADELPEKKTNAIIKGTLISTDNTPMKDIRFFLLEVPFKSEDLQNEKKRKKIFKKPFFCPLIAQTRTDENGQFLFSGVPIGNYFLSAAITQKNIEPGTDYVKSGKGGNLLIFVEGENDSFELKIKGGKALRASTHRQSGRKSSVY